MSNDRRGAAASRRLDVDQGSRVGAVSDPYMAGGLGHTRTEKNGPRLESGVIVDAVPGAHAYVVSAGIGSFLWCSVGGATAGFGVVGGRPLTTLAVGTPVDFVRHPDDPAHGSIVAARPHWSTHTANQPADSIWPFTRTGLQVEAAHQHLLRISENAAGARPVRIGSADAVDFSSGRPNESTTAGECGVLAETGVGVFSDSFQAYLRASEVAGVFASAVDDHLRVAGHNYQQVTSLVEAEHLDDEGELHGFARHCVYAHEYMGLWRYNQVTPGWVLPAAPDHGLAPGQGVRFTNPYDSITGSGDAVREPEFPAQIPAARRYEWSGYLGQGGTTIVAGPAQLDWAYPAVPGGARDAVVASAARPDAPSGRLTVNGSQTGAQPFAVPPNTRGGPDQPGVFSEHVTLTGGLHVRSARRVIISKRCSVPTPRPVRRPEDPAGDSPAGSYSPGGIGDTPHAVAAELATPVAAPHRAVILPDVLAYAFNWEDLHPFAYHGEDWAVADEGAAGSAAVNQQTPDYADLALQQYLEAPPPIALDIDHRYGFADYYENESGLALLDDGSVVLYDGWGSEIRMGGGHIEFRCAGDVCAFPGRNAITWAGHDIDLKAHDTLDAAAVNGDVFLRAEYKFHAVSGNGGCGGFVFENKATCPAYSFEDKFGADAFSSGFNVICPEAAFLVTASDVAVRLADTAPADSRIFLDAGTSRHVYARGRTIVSHVTATGSVVHLFDGSGEPSANEFSETYTFLGGDLTVRGKAYVSDCLAVGQWVTAGQHFASTRANDYGNAVPFFLFDSDFPDIDISTRFDYLTGDYRAAFAAQAVVPPEADDAEFTHRSSAQYKSEDFTYWESRWQAVAKAAGQGLWAWTEPAVVGTVSGEETHAHPGERRLEAGSFLSVAPTFADPDNGWVAIPRAANLGTYEAADTATPVADDLDTALKITTPPG